MAKESTWTGARLRELREAASMSQQELADRLNVSRETVARWETDQREPNWTNVRAMAHAMGVDCRAFEQAPAEGTTPATRGRPRMVQPVEDAAPEQKPTRKKGGGK